MFCLRALNIVHRGFSNTRYLRYNFYNKNLYTLNVYKPKIILKSFINSNNRNLFSIQKCSFHTTPKRYNPLITTIARQFVKVIAIFAGRSFRNWFKRLPKNKKKNVIAWFFRHKWKFIAPFFLLILSGLVYYETHVQETPITKRRRFVAFSPDQFKMINKMELEQQLSIYGNKLLPNDHPLTIRVAKVAKQLLDGNKDILHIKEHDWSVSVINDENTMNAFVLPSGNIFVFSGLLKICDNDEQLGIILSHEISHAILNHGIEMMSHAHAVDIFFIGVIAILWMFLPSDSIAAIGTAISRFVLRIMVDTPYNKMLETEADNVGLILAAKSCFDVREASAFWKKMSMIEKIRTEEMFGTGEVPIKFDFLTTHPSHEMRCENLDKLVESAIKCRTECGCGPLPPLDPRIRVEKLNLKPMKRQPNHEGVLRINSNDAK